MSPQEHADAITQAAAQLRVVVERALRELPVGRAQVAVGAMADVLDDFYRELEDLKAVLAP